MKKIKADQDTLISKIELYLLKEFFKGPPLDSNGGWDSWASATNILKIVRTYDTKKKTK